MSRTPCGPSCAPDPFPCPKGNRVTQASLEARAAHYERRMVQLAGVPQRKADYRHAEGQHRYWAALAAGRTIASAAKHLRFPQGAPAPRPPSCERQMADDGAVVAQGRKRGSGAGRVGLAALRRMRGA